MKINYAAVLIKDYKDVIDKRINNENKALDYIQYKNKKNLDRYLFKLRSFNYATSVPKATQ